MVDGSEYIEEIAYTYDGSPEGLMCAIFRSYVDRIIPADILLDDFKQPRLGQMASFVQTDENIAERVRQGIIKRHGKYVFRCVLKASLSSSPRAPKITFDFVRYAMDEYKNKKTSVISNLANKKVKDFHDIVVAVNGECEKIRQFARFEHHKDKGRDIWFSKISPRDSVVPLVLGHFIERFNVQPFILFDEAHKIAGVWTGGERALVSTDGIDLLENIPSKTPNEELMQAAWKRFYEVLSVDARYNPELRRQMMPKRFWNNLTEMQRDASDLKAIETSLWE